MKLVSLSCNAIPRMPGVRPGDLATIDCDKPSESLRGWRIHIRGQQVFFVSPPGWLRDQNNKQRDPDGPVTVFEVPRADVTLQWFGAADEVEAILKGGKYESPPLGWQPAPAAPIAERPAGQTGDA